MKKISLGLVLGGMFLNSCATDNAGALRDEKRTTLGWLGGSYRVQRNIDVGATLAVQGKAELQYDKDKKAVNLGAFSNLKVGDDKDESLTIRNVEYKTAPSLNLFARYYFWDQSAFFVGGAYSYRKESYKYDALAKGASKFESTVNIEDTYTYHVLSVPVGWAWIWENGFSLGVDIAPAIRIKGSENTTKKGQYSEDDVKWIHDRHHKDGFQLIGAQGTGVIGYSF